MPVGVVVVWLIRRVASRHRICRERRQVAATVVRAVAVVRVVTVGRVVRRHRRLPLDLGGRGGQQVDIEVMPMAAG